MTEVYCLPVGLYNYYRYRKHEVGLNNALGDSKCRHRLVMPEVIFYIFI